MKSDGAKHKKFESRNRPEGKIHTVDLSKPKHDNESIDMTKNGGFSKSRSPITCYTCGKVGHKSVDCDIQKSQTQKDKTAKKSAACQAVEFSDHGSLNRNTCSERDTNRMPWPTVAVASLVNETVYLKDLRYPLRGKCKVAGNNVKFLRDTGSSVRILKSCYLNPDDYTGSTTTVLLADGCVKHLANAIVQVKIPSYSGPLKVCVMENPVSDLIIGNDLYKADSPSDCESDDDHEENEAGIPSVIGQTLIFENNKYQVETNNAVHDKAPSTQCVVVDHGTDDFKMGDGVINTEDDFDHIEEEGKREDCFQSSCTEDVGAISSSSDSVDIAPTSSVQLD